MLSLKEAVKKIAVVMAASLIIVSSAHAEVLKEWRQILR